MRIFVFVLLCVAGACQVTGQSGNESIESFVEYKNDNTVAMGMDGIVIKDKYFVLKIPVELQHRTFIGTSAFMQVLKFKDQAKIMLLYIPNADSSSNYSLCHLSYKKFMNLCEKENLLEDLAEIDFDHRRFFGVNKLENGSFYAIYLNVKRSQLKRFDYSISSVRF